MTGNLQCTLCDQAAMASDAVGWVWSNAEYQVHLGTQL